MSAFLVRLVLAMSLLFGSVAVPAFAGAEPGHHALEMVDLDCNIVESDDPGEGGSPGLGDALALHVDHHHCSACIELGDTRAVREGPVPGDVFYRGRAVALASRTTAPPTQPPSA